MVTRALRGLAVATGLLAAVTPGMAASAGPAAAAPVAAGPAAVARPGPAAASWSKVAVTDSYANQAGILRLAGGQLHLVWRQRLRNGTFAYRTATFSASGHVQSTGTALSGWTTLEGDPRLIPGGPAIRLVFIGGQDTNPSNFFSVGAVYTEVSNGGPAWSLVHASMAQHTVLNLGLAAVARKDKTPVAAFGLNNVLYYHVGLDPSAPAGSPDGSVTGPVAVGLQYPALARASDGSVWLAWYEGGQHRGYYVDKILPTAGTPRRAPGSGTATSADNEPYQQVAFASRPGGGLYLAYCVPTKTVQCAHVDLWRLGSAHAATVPGSATGHAGRVALGQGTGGRMWLAWYDFGANVVRVVRTGTKGSGFGAVAKVARPGPAFSLNGLQGEGSRGPLDLIANITVLKPAAHQELWHIHLPG